MQDLASVMDLTAEDHTRLDTYAVINVEHDRHIDVIRVLHQHADIPAQVADLL